VVNSYTIRLPNATLSGNALIVAVNQNSGTVALSVSDNKGNPYTLAKTNDDTNQKISIYYATNVLAGVQAITLTFSGGGTNWVSAIAAEFYNVAPGAALDGTSAITGNNASVTAGSLTTTLDNDLIFQYAIQDGDGKNTTWSQGSSPWALLAADFFDAHAAQYQVQTTHGTITPALAQGSSKAFNSVAIALKAAAAGTAPSGMRIVHMGHHHVPQAPPGLTNFTLRTPSQGNLIVVSWIGAPGCHIDSISDGNGNAYTSTGLFFGFGGSGDSQMYFAGSAVTSTNLSGPTFALGSGCAGASHNAMVYDVAGAADSPFDTVPGLRTASGNQTTAGNLSTVTITPGTPNGLVVTQTGVNSHTLISVTPGNILSTEVSPDIATGAIDNNNGWAIYYNANTSPATFVYGTKSGQADTWASIAAAFKASGSAPSPFDFSVGNGGNRSVIQGQSVTNTITANLLSGTTQSVSFSAPGLPSGTTASFSPPSCSPGCTSTLTLTTSATTPTGPSTITVTGTGGSLSRTTSFTLTVNAPPPPLDFALTNGGNRSVVQGQAVSNIVTATLVSGTAQSVSFAASSLPAGTTASFSPASCSPTCSSTLTLTTSASTPTGSSTITVTGTGGSQSRTTMFTLTVNAAAFDFSVSNGGNRSVAQGQSVSNTITATLISGTTQSVSFSASGLPSGATASFSPASCSPTCSSTLTLTASVLTPTGSSTITVTGTGGSLSRTTTFTLTVTPLLDFLLSNGGNQSVVQGQPVSNTITASLIAGATQSVSFLASGLPAGTTASFSPASCSPMCSSTLTLMTSASTPTGSSTITVTGTGGSLSRTTMFTLTVNAAPAPEPPAPSPPPPSPPPPVPPGPAPTVSFSIPQDGLQQWMTTATTDSIQIGFARAQVDAGTTPPSGLAIFGLRSSGVLVTEASVPAAPVMQYGRIYAEVNGPVNTGIAFANPTNQEASISFYFTDAAGNDYGFGLFTLGGNHQMAAFLSEAPFNGRAPMQGTLTFSSSVPVGVIAVRGFTNERSEFLVTTLPVAAISNPSNNTIVLPQFADGGGWTTQIILTNPTDIKLTGNVQFFSPGSATQSGVPLSLMVNGATNSTFNYVVQPRSAVRFVTGNPPGNVQVGAVRITPSADFAPVALAVFSMKSNGITVNEAGVSALSNGIVFRMYAEASGAVTQIGSIQTGVAIGNPSSAPVPVNLELTRLDGSSLGTPVTVTVPPNGQLARFLGELLPTLQGAFQGLLKATAPTPVSMIGVRGRYNERGDFLITTTPPRNEGAILPGTDVAFPQIAGGGGYNTQVIVFGPPGSGRLFFYSQDGRLLGSETLQRIP